MKVRIFMVFSFYTRDTVSHVGFFNPSCELLPIYLLSDLPHLSPSFPKLMYTVDIQTVCGCGLWGGGGGGGVELFCRPYSGEFNTVSDQNQNLQNCFTTPQKPVKTTFRDWCLYSSFVHAVQVSITRKFHSVLSLPMVR